MNEKDECEIIVGLQGDIAYTIQSYLNWSIKDLRI